jgi:hypothetical protein
MNRVQTRLGDERGMALVSAIILVGLLTTVAVCLMGMTTLEGDSSSAGVVTSNALEAAEAGLDAYKADLTEDTGFYLDYVVAGEARRTYNGTQYPTTAGANANANVSLNPSWPRTATWTYPADVTSDPGWRTLSGTSYQYLLEVFPSTTTFNNTRIIAIGRPIPSSQYPASDTSNYRAVEAEVSVLSLSDFQMLAAKSIQYGAGATTNGWVYATLDDSGNPTTVSQTGGGTWTASEDIFTESPKSTFTGSITLTNGAIKYAKDTTPSIRTVISEPITFADIRQSNQIAPVGGGEGAIQLDAASQGITLDGSLTNGVIPNAWKLVFQPGPPGSVDIWRCTKYKSPSTGAYYPVANQAPTCTYVTNKPLNQTGGEEIYSNEDVIVQGTVNAQVTIYAAGGGTATVGDRSQSEGDILIGDDISYRTQGANVLGLVAQENVIVPCWEPEQRQPLTWQAATVALNGEWTSDVGFDRNYPCSMSNTSMVFTGSTATDQGGSMGGFASRTYNYDTTLRYLPPPDYPQIPAALKVMYQRQVGVP